jgi:hypothetical protein
MTEYMSLFKPLRIICIAILTGNIIFSLVMIYLAINTGAAPEPDSSLSMLRYIHFAMTVTMIFVSQILSVKILRSGSSDTLEEFYPRYQSAAIIRIAFIEGTVLLGGIVFFLAGQKGVVRGDITYYLHFIPLLLLALIVKVLYPSTDKVEMMRRTFSR